jgi:hypothetical protein
VGGGVLGGGRVVGGGVRKSGEGVVWKTTSTSNFRFFAQKFILRFVLQNV